MLEPPGQELESPLEAATLGEAVREGELLFQIRPRYTWADQDGRAQNARWGSVRTRLGWKTLEYRGFSALVEGINVARFAASGYLVYQDTPASTNGIGFAPGSYTPGFYPLIADPNTTDFNRLYVDYAGLPHTLVRVGRQLVRIDNQRFIGDYDSAQLPQSFTGVTFENTSVPGLRLIYGYFTHVRNSYAVQWDTSTSAFNVSYEVAPPLKIAGYAYLQNQPVTGSVTGFADNSNKIFGGRVWGGWQVTEALELLYSAELAEQRSYAGGNPLIDASYQRLGAGASTRRGYLRVDWELLGSNGSLYGFQTPLGVTQLFTGFTNVFASTPSRGLQDLRASLGVNLGTGTAALGVPPLPVRLRALEPGPRAGYRLDLVVHPQHLGECRLRRLPGGGSSRRNSGYAKALGDGGV